MSGGRKPRFDDDDILRAFTESSQPVLTTSEIAEKFDYDTTSGARKRLESLENDGLLISKPVGPAQVWYISDEGREYLETE